MVVTAAAATSTLATTARLKMAMSGASNLEQQTYDSKDNNNRSCEFELSLEDAKKHESSQASFDENENNFQNASADEPIVCSAVHTLERDMPDFDYSHLVKELREKILKDCQENVGIYSQTDIEKCKNDEWFITRFLLRQKLDVGLAFDMMRKAMRFRHESLANSIRREDFPAEFYKIGGLFGYEPDRKGNKMLYIRVKVHKKIQEINAVLQAFLYYNIQYLDDEANGRGISIVFDCSGGGLANADMDMLLFLVTTLTSYFPKGLSYLLVHELPWILKPFWYIAKGWLPEEHRQLIKFSNSRTIYEYVDRENLPDFMGGTCKRDYRAVPDNCTTLKEAAKLWGLEGRLIKRILLKFADHLPEDSLKEAEELAADSPEDSDQENNH